MLTVEIREYQADDDHEPAFVVRIEEGTTVNYMEDRNQYRYNTQPMAWVDNDGNPARIYGGHRATIYPTRYEAAEAFIAAEIHPRNSRSSYDVLAVGDGYIQCPECAAEHYRAQFEASQYTTASGPTMIPDQDPQEGGEYCETCTREIEPPYCGECGTTDRPLFSNTAGDRRMCSQCIAEALVRPDDETPNTYSTRAAWAEKIAKRTYQVTGYRQATDTAYHTSNDTYSR